MEQKAKQLLETLKKALKDTNSRGRPRRVMKEEFVLPSKIKKKYRTFATKVLKYSDPRLYPIVEEYKRKLYDLARKKKKTDKNINIEEF
jgi:hypothetical protein